MRAAERVRKYREMNVPENKEKERAEKYRKYKEMMSKSATVAELEDPLLQEKRKLASFTSIFTSSLKRASYYLSSAGKKKSRSSEPLSAPLKIFPYCPAEYISLNPFNSSSPERYPS